MTNSYVVWSCYELRAAIISWTDTITCECGRINAAARLALDTIDLWS